MLDDAAPPTLAEILTLSPALDDAGEPRADTYLGHSPPERRARVFGGQVVAQALVAASATAASDHHVHSLHAYFLRGGEVEEPIAYEVERLRDGRSFTARRVTAVQRGEAILVLSASFHAGGPGGDYEPPGPVGVPTPDDHLPPTRFAKPGVLETLDASYDQPFAPQRRLWFRAGCELPPELHAAGVAYATDHGPFGAARRIVDTAGAGRFDTMFRASLDHAIWFHRPPRIDDWVLYDIEAVAHRDDRILTSGRIVDGAGRRIATVAQEILARSPAAG
ncbi:MAG TPA: acyl-CoA thioesterase domain-containing protein [Acidimicrobiales bacterium]|nr:acyl-CoA thioesterase domain-containing protein [Acidimicrobiales bacterium]